MSFAAMKSRLQANGAADYSKKVEDALGGSGGYKKDDRYWNLTVNKSGVGQAIIRFMPEPEGEEMPIVKILEHSFYVPNGDKKDWYIEKSRATLGEPDYATDWANEHRNSSDASLKELAKKRSPSSKYVSNVYIVSDPANPANEGKVMLFKYGAAIKKMLESGLKPEFDGDPIVNAFDPFAGGANFALRAYNGDNGMRTYDKSKFESAKPLFDSDAKIEAVWQQCHSLKAEIAPEKFKDYETLKKRYIQVCKLQSPQSANTQSTAVHGQTTQSQQFTQQSQMPANTDSSIDEYQALLGD